MMTPDERKTIVTHRLSLEEAADGYSIIDRRVNASAK